MDLTQARLASEDHLHGVDGLVQRFHLRYEFSRCLFGGCCLRCRRIRAKTKGKIIIFITLALATASGAAAFGFRWSAHPNARERVSDAKQ